MKFFDRNLLDQNREVFDGFCFSSLVGNSDIDLVDEVELLERFDLID